MASEYVSEYVIGVGPNQTNTSLSAAVSWALANSHADCVSNDEILVFEVYDFEDTTAVGIGSGFTTDETRYIVVRPGVDETDGDGSHDGRSRDVSGSGYQLTTSGGYSLALGNSAGGNHIRIEGICLKNSNTSTASNYHALDLGVGSWASGSDCRITDCIIFGAAPSASTRYLISSSEANLNLTMSNCIVYDNRRPLDTRNANSADFDHCTFYGGSDLGPLSETEGNYYNCYSGGHTAADWWSGTTAGGDYNGSEDTTATTEWGGNATNSLTASSQFNNASLGSSADFLLKAGNGMSVGGSGSSVSDDILGNARDGSTPDLGASEYVTAASGNPHYYYAQQ